MDTKIHKRNVMCRRPGTADVFQQIETEFFPKVVIVPVISERKSHMVDSLLHQYCRILHQIEDKFIAVTAENGFHT